MRYAVLLLSRDRGLFPTGRLRRDFGFAPAVPFEEGIARPMACAEGSLSTRFHKYGCEWDDLPNRLPDGRGSVLQAERQHRDTLRPEESGRGTLRAQCRILFPKADVLHGFWGGPQGSARVPLDPLAFR